MKEVTRQLTDELAVPKDDKKPDPDGLSKVGKAKEELGQVISAPWFLLNIFKTNAGNTCLWDGDEEPDDAGDGEEDGGEEETVVVPELGDGGRGSKGSGGTGDFVEDMLDEGR